MAGYVRAFSKATSGSVEEAGSGRPLLSAQAREPVNPASLAKLLTTYAALDRLGPAWAWRTPVWLDGTLRDGVLEGALVLQGRAVGPDGAIYLTTDTTRGRVLKLGPAGD